MGKRFSSSDLGFEPATKTQGPTQPTFSSKDLGFEPSPAPEPAKAPSWQEKTLEKANAAKSALVNFVAGVGRKVDSVTGAPARKALGTMQDGGDLIDAAKAGWEQFGSDPEAAPTGKEIAAKAGFSTEQTIPAPWVELDQKGLKMGKFSPAGAAGLAVDVVVDPTNFIPVTKIAKGAGTLASKAVGKGTDIGTSVLAGAVDAVTGTAVAGNTVKAGKEQIRAAKLALSDLFNPKRADDYTDYARIAERNGIPVSDLPEAVEFGPDSIITRASRVRAEGPLGQADLEKFRQVTEKTKRATEAKVQAIGGGRILRPEEAGQLIREGYDQAVDRLMRGSSDTYRSISAANPGLLLNADEAAKLGDKLEELGKFAESRVKMGMTSAQKSQAKQLQEAVDSLRQAMSEGWEQGTNVAVGRPLFDDMVQRLQILGEAAFKKQGGLDLDPPDLKRLRGLYGDMREAIIGTIEKDLKGGSELAQRLRENNAAISKFLDERSPLEAVLGNKNLADENVYRRLVADGDTTKIEALRQILTPDQLQQLKGTFLDGLIAKDLDGDFTFGSTVTRMKTKQTNLEALLSPEEIKEFADLVRLGDRYGTPIMSTSGTGASNIFKNIKEGVTNSIVSESFIKSLKNRARQAPPPKKPGTTVPTPVGDMNITNPGAPGGGFSGNFGGPSSAAVPGILSGAMDFRKPTGIDRRLKGAQVFSVQDFDENEERRKAIRRRLEQERNK
jgi:hypothetical protein